MIKKRLFGRTGHPSSITLFGAAALGKVSQKDADRALDTLLKYGVNHIDTAMGYGDSELRVGPWMKRYRDEFFLATKTGERTYEGAKKGIQESMERLQVEQIDLMQIHALTLQEEWDLVMGSGGALEALVEARDQGFIRFIGVTGHGWMMPSLHLRSLARFDFDSILLPYNYVMHDDQKYNQAFEEVLKVCEEKTVAVQTIKSIARGPWATTTPSRNTWYQPLEEQEDIDNAIHWVMGKPGIFVNTVGDVELLPKVLDAADRFEEKTSDLVMKKMVETKRMSSLFGLGA
ncbi:MAG: aldo/keto reductase [SAR324 cluster bacterium]|nr:aldo/keto reductase [SAR324 cluster bacterium]